jgi:hypothetical protein
MHRIGLHLLVVLFTVLLAAPQTAADEGMWPLYTLNKLDFTKLRARGLELTPNEIFNEQDGGIAAAVCQVGGGTGSFVSPEGLIVTNHHVAFGAIQQQSDVDQNYLHDGFLAPTKADEIPAIGYDVYITQSFRDVTKEIKNVLKKGMTDLERYKAIEKKKKELVKKAEQQGNVRCYVSTAYSGLQYFLVTSFRIQDVRIVYIPPQAIGEYGGDIDNWMWPRHCGDFSFLRAYVAPDGSSAQYADENVPFRPKKYLPISSGQLNEGDFAMIIGYPGGTSRYRSSYSIADNVNHYYPSSIKDMTNILRIMDQVADEDPMAAIRLAGRSKGINNYLKNQQGMLKGLKRARLLEKKQAQEKELTAFIAADPELAKKYGDVLPGLAKLYADRAAYREMDNVFGDLSWICRYYNLAHTLYRWSIEKTKKDMAREPKYMERNVDDLKRGLKETQFSIVPAADQKLFEYLALRALRLPAARRIAELDGLFIVGAGDDTTRAIHDIASAMYEKSKVGVLEDRMAMFDLSTEELLALNDPFINLARDLYELDLKIEDRDKAFSGALEQLQPKLIEAYAAQQQEMFYPDANGTIRLSYGEVKGYAPGDAATYKYVTTLTGIIEKETGEEPFANPQELLDVYASGDFGDYVDPTLGDVPVNFLTTNDGTGGNSGSPIFNGKGEVIGLDFDTNWEGVVGDYYFDPEIKRSICVDTRYILFILDRVYGAQSVLDELTIH